MVLLRQNVDADSISDLSVFSEKIPILSAQLSQGLPYYPTLVALRSVLEREFFLYPYDYCEHASRLVREVLELRYGVEEVIGNFLWEETLGLIKPHMWNYDSSHGLYIDLSIDQFYFRLPKVAVFPQRIRFLQEEKKQRYIPQSTKMLGIERIVDTFSKTKTR